MLRRLCPRSGALSVRLSARLDVAPCSYRLASGVPRLFLSPVLAHGWYSSLSSFRPNMGGDHEAACHCDGPDVVSGG